MCMKDKVEISRITSPRDPSFPWHRLQFDFRYVELSTPVSHTHPRGQSCRPDVRDFPNFWKSLGFEAPRDFMHGELLGLLWLRLAPRGARRSPHSGRLDSKCRGGHCRICHKGWSATVPGIEKGILLMPI